jgi:hypothetical protein
MGLLDDAIREHLELKRLRGADPGAVARAEQDALGPISRDRNAEQATHEESKDDSSDADTSFLGSDPDPPPSADSVSGGQETVEINMEAELAGGQDAGSDPPARQTGRAQATQPAQTQNTEESLEWEMPSDRAEIHDRGVDHGGDPDSRKAHDGETGDQVDDVLEETPDFLRDTPEQERLWFEQRPPRDFDFDD